jgi:CMP-N-acetylneuraminic acid synthetase
VHSIASQERILVTICARGGSKGIPGKNIRIVAGKPLIAYSIHLAEAFAKSVGAGVELALSTDSLEIKAVAAEYGLVTDYLRPAELATDACGKIPVLDHVLRHHEAQLGKPFDYLLDLDVTSPLRTLDDLLAGIELLKGDARAYNLFSVQVARKNPYFNIVELSENGYLYLSKALPNAILSRQNAPRAYDIDGAFYIYRRVFFESGFPSAITPATIPYIMPHASLDLDEPIDLEFLEFLLTQNRLSFEIL